MTRPAPTRPTGTITRGTTHPNRLRRADRWLIHTACADLRRLDRAPLVVDLGFGASPITTVELHSRLIAHVRADIDVLGLEIDQQRVAAAEPHARTGLAFARGGYEVGPAPRPPFIIRAFNVLRQYDETDVGPAWALMASRLQTGGFVLEGTCDEIGRRATWVRIDHSGSPVSLTLSAHVGSLEKPSDLAERLPKALIHRNIPGEAIHEVFVGLDRAWAAAAPVKPFGPRQRWLAMATSAHNAKLGLLNEPSRWRLGEITFPWTAVAPG